MKSLVTILLGIFLLFPSTLIANNTCDILKTSSSINSSEEINLEILLYRDTARLRILNDQNIRIGKRNRIDIKIRVKQLVYPTNVKNLQLKISPSFTSLIPVKIPPPPSSSARQKNSNQIYYCITLEDFDVLPEETGIHNISFELSTHANDNIEQDCIEAIQPNVCYIYNNFYDCDINTGFLLDTEVVYFEVYDFVDIVLTDPEIKRDLIDEVKIDYCSYYKEPWYGDFNNFDTLVSLKLYASLNETLDGNDILLNQRFTRLDYYSDENRNECLATTVSNEILESIRGQKLLCVVDQENKVYEIDETNNIKVIEVLPDLYISDIRMYKTPDNNVILSSTVTNNGNVASELSKLDFYVEKYPRKFVARTIVPPLEPGKSRTVRTSVTWRYFSLVLHGRDLIIIADADNDVQEIDETNNEKRFRAPRNLHNIDQNPSLVTASPNPFSSYIEFDYEVKYTNTDIKLSIYDQRGILRFQTSKFHIETGNFKFKIYSSQINGGANGIYHYSFLLGRNNTLYYPSTGTIIKQ